MPLNLIREFYTNETDIDFTVKEWEYIGTVDPVRVQVFENDDGKQFCVLSAKKDTAARMAMSWYHHLFGEDNE